MADTPDAFDLVFTLVISYFGALEFFFVVRHLYHWTFRHAERGGIGNGEANDNDLSQQLAAADAAEAAAGANVMQDGVRYVNGFRVDDPAQPAESSESKQQRIAAELERQRRIEAETRQQLAAAEAKLAKERELAKLAEAEEQERRLLEAERQKEAEQRRRELADAAEAEENERRRQRAVEEEAENSRRLLEAERQREAEQRERELEEENSRRLLEAERQREAEQRERELAEENSRRLFEAERQREAEQRERELAEENSRRLFEAERQREAEQRERELEEELEAAEETRKLAAAERQREEEQRQKELDEEAESARKLLDAEKEEELVQRRLEEAFEQDSTEESELEFHSRGLHKPERSDQDKQKLIEENARRFLEAEEEMVVLQQRMLDATHESEYEGQSPVVEEPCVKKTVTRHFQDEQEPPIIQKVKTQFGQAATSELPYSLSSKTLVFPGVSDEGSSLEPFSSGKSSFSTGGGASEAERQEPDGGEDQVPEIKYTDEQLRSLDGIKSRQGLAREDGSGRRRAFKKRRSSGSSNSSRDSRTSREEELKMFTSLEEEEQLRRDDFTPIKYNNDTTLRVKPMQRRHRRSPAKDSSGDASNLRGSLERLGEETTNPWGEIVPEHYKDTEFWQREKAMSIDEEELELDAEIVTAATKASQVPKTASFESATHAQSEAAAIKLTKPSELDVNVDVKANEESKTNLQIGSGSGRARSRSPGLRRSPRIDEADSQDEQFSSTGAASQATASNTPSIKLTEPDTKPWRDEHGLVMEGLSDFYDFVASVNPSRSKSRSGSRQPSPKPDNVAYEMPETERAQSLDVYDDTDELAPEELQRERVLEFIERHCNYAPQHAELELLEVADDPADVPRQLVSLLYEFDDTSVSAADNFGAAQQQHAQLRSRSCSPLPTMDNVRQSLETRRQKRIQHNDEVFERLRERAQTPEAAAPIPTVVVSSDTTDSGSQDSCSSQGNASLESLESLVATLRLERSSRSRTRTHTRSRSRSRSPLPTLDNVQRSLESRRQMRIQHNDELFEQLREHTQHWNSLEDEKVEPRVIIINESSLEEESSEASTDSAAKLKRSLFQRSSRSRSRSPIPTPDNVERSLAARQQRRIHFNDELFEQLRERTPSLEDEPVATKDLNIPTIVVGEDNKQKAEERENMELLVATLRAERGSHSRSHSRSPLPTMDNVQRSLESRRQKRIEFNELLFEKLSEQASSASSSFSSSSTEEYKVFDEEQLGLKESAGGKDMSELVATLRAERSSRSRSRSHSPLPTMDNVQRSLESRRQKRIEFNELISEKLTERATSSSSSEGAEHSGSYESTTVPTILIGEHEEPKEPSREHGSVHRLVTNLRTARSSRSRSHSPLPTAGNIQRSLDSRQHKREQHNDELFEKLRERVDSPESSEYCLPKITIASATESASDSDTDSDVDTAESMSALVEQLRLNRSRSTSRACSPMPGGAAAGNLERHDELFKRCEELFDRLAERERTPEPTRPERDARSRSQSRSLTPSLDVTPTAETQSAAEACSSPANLPPTPEYARTFSEDCRDVQRIKRQMLASGFKRSTYVGESLDLGSEYESQRREAAHFQRSRTPSPSIVEEAESRERAAEQRELQAAILASLTADSQAHTAASIAKQEEEEQLAATKTKPKPKPCNFVFERSRSKSRSPLTLEQSDDLQRIEAEAARRGRQDELLDQFAASTLSFQTISRHLNVDFLESERRASDSAVVNNAALRAALKDGDVNSEQELEPEEYHHYRRYSLAQEPPSVEEEEDYVCVAQVEVHTTKGTRTWIKEDFYSEEFISKHTEFEVESSKLAGEAISLPNAPEVEERERYSGYSTNDSEDERQTVVGVEDECDEGISDNNERGAVTDESQHETSECEEAERQADCFANRSAQDWATADAQAANEEDEDEDDNDNNDDDDDDEESVRDFLDYKLADSAAGGAVADSDKFIEQIYNEAITNRRQSGIMRDYEGMLKSELSASESDLDGVSRRSSVASSELSTTSESGERARRGNRARYRAGISLMNSVRLRTRYGYNPVAQLTHGSEVDDVDITYKPKREYNWRKNFKLDDDDKRNDKEQQASQRQEQSAAGDSVSGEEEALQEYDELNAEYLDMRRYSLGGESITLFSRSPARELLPQVVEGVEMATPAEEQTKKRKIKKKVRKSAKTEEHADESLCTSRRSSSAAAVADAIVPLERKSTRMRRASKASIDTSETSYELSNEQSTKPTKKTTKKRKKSRLVVTELLSEELQAAVAAGTSISAQLSPATSQLDLLLAGASSSADSVCVTPGSIASDARSASSSSSREQPTSLPKSNSSSTVESFDLLKDANFYPLF